MDHGDQPDLEAEAQRVTRKRKRESPTSAFEEARQNAEWVLGIADPSLVLERLHETYLHLVFEGPLPESDNESEEGSEVMNGRNAGGQPVRRLQTVAEDKVREEMREELNELLAPAEGKEDEAHEGDAEEEEDLFDFDRLTENLEEDDRPVGELDEFDDEFQQWIGPDAVGEEGGAVFEERPAEIKWEMERVGLGVINETMIDSEIPERFKQIDLEEKQGLFTPGAKEIPGLGRGFVVSRDVQAQWILRQLCRPGAPFHRNERVVKRISEPVDHWKDDAVVRSIEYVLRCLQDEYLEPGYLMMYRQTQLMPLLDVLWDAQRLDEYNEGGNVNCSYAYSTTTGRRVEPEFGGDDQNPEVGFSLYNLQKVIGKGDERWDLNEGAKGRVRRKPCVIELGRLLWTIVHLDGQCHAFERSRHTLIAQFQHLEKNEFMHEISQLEFHAFDHSMHVEAWNNYLRFSKKMKNMIDPATADTLKYSPSAEIDRLQLRDAFSRYTMTAQQYQRNICEGFMMHRLPPPVEGVRIDDWARHEGELLPRVQAGDRILRLFNAAIVEQFSFLPTVRISVFEQFLSAGTLRVRPTSPKTRAFGAVEISIAELLNGGADAFIEYLELERRGEVKLEPWLEISEVLRVLDLAGCYYDPPDESISEEQLSAMHRDLDAGTISNEDAEVLNAYTARRSWADEHKKIAIPLAEQLISCVSRSVDNALRGAAAQAAIQRCVENLANFCVEGPYEVTQLNITGYHPRLPTWDSRWNIVEALRVEIDDETKFFVPEAGHVRVCSAFHADNGTTVFVFLDERGCMQSVARWVDTGRLRGEAIHALIEQQFQELLQAMQKCVPHVVVVGATDPSAQSIFKKLQRFMTEKVQTVIRRDIPVIWGDPSVARVAAWSESIRKEMGSTDTPLLTAISLGRYIRNPLWALSTLFNHNSAAGGDALRLPIAIPPPEYVDHRKLYRALEWEMSLWVAATGVDINHAMSCTQPEMILQFVPGLGWHKAVELSTRIHNEVNGVIARRDGFAVLLGNLGRFTSINSLPFLRVFPQLDAVKYAENMLEPPGPLDCTLIPTEWVPAAEAIAFKALPETGNGSLAVVELIFNKSEEERFQCIAKLVGYTTDGEQPEDGCPCNAYEFRSRCKNDAEDQSDDAAYELWRSIGWREVDLIFDELIAAGRSYATRPFRFVTSEGLLRMLFGVVWGGDKRPEVRCSYIPQSSLTLHKGDIVEAVVQSLIFHPKQSLGLTTHFGLSAKMELDTVTDPVVTQSATDCFRDFEAFLAAAPVDEANLPKNPKVPLALRRRVLHGVVTGIFWPRLELRLEYRTSPDPLQERPAVREAPEKIEAFVPSVVTSREGSSEYGGRSVNTVMIEAQATAHVTKAASHVLFRNVSTRRMEELLAQHAIGEALLRNSEVSKTHFIISFNSATKRVSHIDVKEDRKADGTLKYVISLQHRDRKETYTFEDVDHCLHSFITPYVDKIFELRAHHKYKPTPDALDLELHDQAKENPLKLCYGFCEYDGQPSKYEYCLAFTVPHRSIPIRVPLSISPDGYYLKVQEQYWFCTSPNEIINKLKQHVQSVASDNVVATRRSMEHSRSYSHRQPESVRLYEGV